MDGTFRIGILQRDMTFRDSGEGPWSSYGEAEEFQENEVGMPSAIIGGHDHDLSVRNVKFHPNLSEETMCFSCELISDTIKVADVSNDGKGGSHRYLWADAFYRKMIVAWSLAQETDYPAEKLDQIVNKLLEDV